MLGHSCNAYVIMRGKFVLRKCARRSTVRNRGSYEKVIVPSKNEPCNSNEIPDMYIDHFRYEALDMCISFWPMLLHTCNWFIARTLSPHDVGLPAPWYGQPLIPRTYYLFPAACSIMQCDIIKWTKIEANDTLNTQLKLGHRYYS